METAWTRASMDTEVGPRVPAWGLVFATGACRGSVRFRVDTRKLKRKPKKMN